jgi:putative (di)nucleoside polyphosphate hydrolase
VELDCIDANGFRANVGMILTNGDGVVLLAGRVGQDGWQFPQGGMRAGELLEEAMYRELQEEVGLGAQDVDILGVTRDWLSYRLPERYVRRDSTPVCIGQKQRWFLLLLRSQAQRVRFDTTTTPEFDRWRWVPYWEPVSAVIHFKRQVYAAALRELAPLIFPDGAPPQPNWPTDWRLGSSRDSRRRLE